MYRRIKDNNQDNALKHRAFEVFFHNIAFLIFKNGEILMYYPGSAILSLYSYLSSYTNREEAFISDIPIISPGAEL